MAVGRERQMREKWGVRCAGWTKKTKAGGKCISTEERRGRRGDGVVGDEGKEQADKMNQS